MPIYAYRCEDCGFAKDVLQKISDAPLKDCLACGKPTFKKQVTAAGFQLKGSGWYVTDFRGGSSTNVPPVSSKSGEAGGKGEGGSDKAAGSASGSASSGSSSATSSATSSASGSSSSNAGGATGTAPATKATPAS
jgi:putative FmdB family regulatory protein